METIPPKEQWRDPSAIIIAMVAIGGNVHRIEAFMHEGTIWLAPEWTANDAEGWMRPTRIVSLKTIPHILHEGGQFPLVLNGPMPEDMIPPNPPLETSKRTLVVEYPSIWFAIPTLN